MARDNLLAIDQGTASTQVVPYDAKLRPVGQGHPR
jgi:glycerol kinase